MSNLAEAVELYLGAVEDPPQHVTATRHLVPSIRRRVSPTLSDLSVRKATWVIEYLGFAYVRTKGSHAVYRHPDGRAVVIPYTAPSSEALSRQSCGKPASSLASSGTGSRQWHASTSEVSAKKPPSTN
jgi:predicted RNA binding protein YcfA (HicA-like mRNA interferase family)